MTDIDIDKIKSPEIKQIVLDMQNMSRDYANNSETMMELIELVRYLTEEIRESNPILAGRIHNKMMDIIARHQSGVTIVKN